MDEDEDVATSPTDSLMDNEFPSPKHEIASHQQSLVSDSNSLVFHNLNYTVTVKKNWKKTQKQILFNCR